MALWYTGILAKAQAAFFKDDPSPFGDSHPDVRVPGETDGNNSEVKAAPANQKTTRRA